MSAGALRRTGSVLLNQAVRGSLLGQGATTRGLRTWARASAAVAAQRAFRVARLHPTPPRFQPGAPPRLVCERRREVQTRGMSAGSGGSIPGRLLGHEDAYEGLILDPDGLPDTVEEFAAALDESIPAWHEHGYRGIWLKVPSSRAHFVGHAVDRGFEFHHAEKDYLMLTRWLPDSENKLPPNASHQVGVGAFVLNERREVLVVQERNGPLRGKGVWKMPTGLVQAGEDISEAAEREVLEETGVRARFDCVLAMRQAHGFAFGKSDMFFCVALKLEAGPQELRMQEDELVGVRWMPLQEYLAIDFHSSRPLLRQIQATCVAWADDGYRGLHGRKLEAGFSGRQDLLLFGEAADRQGADKLSERDTWIGLDTPAAGSGGATAGSGKEGAAQA